MNKEDIKKAIKAAVKNNIITVNFINGVGGAPPRSPKTTVRNAVKSGQFKVITPRVGKGQGGSLFLDLVSIGEDPVIIEIGTPYAEELLSIDLGNGIFFGYKHEHEIPKKSVDILIAKAIKEKIKFLSKEKPERLQNWNIEIEATTPDSFLNGKWNVVKAETMIGKYGEIKLTLEKDDINFVFGSHSHSAFIKNINLYFCNTKLS